MIRFAAIADIQYADQENASGRDYRASIAKFLEAAGVFAESNVPFVLQLGDAANGEMRNLLAMKELFDVAEKNGVAWRHAYGNHDFLTTDAEKAAVYEMFGVPKPGYYDFSVVDSDDSANRWRFVVLNGNEISEYAAENDAERAAARAERERNRLANDELPAVWNGAVSKTQLDWLDSRLADAEKAGENALVCSHFPLFASSKSLQTGGKLAKLFDVGIYFSTLGVSTWNGAEILDVLDRHSCVRGYLAGHLHEGAFGIRKNAAHMTLRGVVEASPNAFSFVELRRDGISVDGRGAQPSFKFSF